MSLPSPPLSIQSEPTIQPSSPAGRQRLRVVLDGALRVAGGVLAVFGAAVTALLEVLLATLRVGGTLIGVSAVLAVLANVALSWFAVSTVGRRWAIALPAVTWFTLMVIVAGGTAEGDILLAGNNWVGLALIVAGSMTFAIMAFRAILAPRPGQPPRPGRPSRVQDPQNG